MSTATAANTKFKKNVLYKSKAIIFSPYGVIPVGAVKKGKDWEDILVYEIGNCGISGMFDVVEKKNNKD